MFSRSQMANLTERGCNKNLRVFFYFIYYLLVKGLLVALSMGGVTEYHDFIG